MAKKENIIIGIGLTGIVGFALVSIPGANYADFPGPSKNHWGRTNNAVATMVTGIVANELYDSSTFEMEMQKTLWWDTEITGYADSGEINAYMDLFWTKSEFIATDDGTLEGVVEKSEFNWQVTENDDGTYSITRFGPKWNRVLEITVEDGRIEGKYNKPFGPVDWTFEGTYDSRGNVEIDFDIPFAMDFNLEGKITEQE